MKELTDKKLVNAVTNKPVSIPMLFLFLYGVLLCIQYVHKDVCCRLLTRWLPGMSHCWRRKWSRWMSQTRRRRWRKYPDTPRSPCIVATVFSSGLGIFSVSYHLSRFDTSWNRSLCGFLAEVVDLLVMPSTWHTYFLLCGDSLSMCEEAFPLPSWSHSEGEVFQFTFLPVCGSYGTSSFNITPLSFTH